MKHVYALNEVDVIALGDHEENMDKLNDFIKTVSSNDSRLVHAYI